VHDLVPDGFVLVFRYCAHYALALVVLTFLGKAKSAVLLIS
jgi:hypothetical protein